jgi:intracellular sulfur oxidation DsrE/DsrF family protein
LRSHSTGQQDAITHLLARLVAGDAAALDELILLPPAAVIEAAFDHGAIGFLHDALQGSRSQQSELARQVVPVGRKSVSLDMVREAELKRALAALADAGVQALVMKGGQLAYSHYSHSHLRPRVDTDLLIQSASRKALDGVLGVLHYVRQPGISGELVMSQSMYLKSANETLSSALDVHWRIANPQVFAGALEYDELRAAAVPIPALGPDARGLSTPHALLLACVHRIAHHMDSERLIWLYDIHLLARSMSAADWNTFAQLAAERQVVAVCRRSLERTAARFATIVPNEVWEHPRWAARSTAELSAGYLEARRPISAIADDLRALRSWRERRRLAREHLLPPADYMRTVFAPGSRAPLAWLYTRRLLSGARKWLSR